MHERKKTPLFSLQWKGWVARKHPTKEESRFQPKGRVAPEALQKEEEILYSAEGMGDSKAPRLRRSLFFRGGWPKSIQTFQRYVLPMGGRRGWSEQPVLLRCRTDQRRGGVMLLTERADGPKKPVFKGWGGCQKHTPSRGKVPSGSKDEQRPTDLTIERERKLEPMGRGGVSRLDTPPGVSTSFH